MKKAAFKNTASALTLLFAVTYMVSYLTRINYGAVISQMVADTGFSKSQLSMALTGSFITYGAGQLVSGVLLPLFGLFCIQTASTLYIRKFSNPLSCAGVFFFTGTLASLALFCFTGKNAAFSVFFSALLTGCMHGVNLIQVCMIPPFF